MKFGKKSFCRAVKDRRFKFLSQLKGDNINEENLSRQFSATQPQYQTSLFSIDELTGVIRTTARIDRESLCPQNKIHTHNVDADDFYTENLVSETDSKEMLNKINGKKVNSEINEKANVAECRKLFYVAVLPLKSFRLIKVLITILDVNDNSPQFESSSLRLEVPESTSLGTSFSLPSALDADAPPLNTAAYRLVTALVSHYCPRFTVWNKIYFKLMRGFK